MFSFTKVVRPWRFGVYKRAGGLVDGDITVRKQRVGREVSVQVSGPKSMYQRFVDEDIALIKKINGNTQTEPKLLPFVYKTRVHRGLNNIVPSYKSRKRAR